MQRECRCKAAALAEFEKTAAGLILPGSDWEADPFHTELAQKLDAYEDGLRQDKARTLLEPLLVLND